MNYIVYFMIHLGCIKSIESVSYNKNFFEINGLINLAVMPLSIIIIMQRFMSTIYLL